MKHHNKIKSFSSFERIMNYDNAAAYNRALCKILKSMKRGSLASAASKYFHDLDSYMVGTHNCLTIPFDKLMRPKRITGYLTPNWETQTE